MIRIFIQNPKFTYVLTALIMTMGGIGLWKLKSESFPTVNFGTVIITTYYDGASSREIETLITMPIENEIRTVQGIKEVRSVSQPGLSQITTTVDIDNYNAEDVIGELQRAVDRVRDLPQDLREPPQFIEIKSDEIPVWDLAITGPNDNRERDQLAERLKDVFEDISMVSKVTLSGAGLRRFNILVDPQKLLSFHVSLDQVVQGISAHNIDVPGGYIEDGNKQKLLRIEGKVKDIEAINNIVIRANFSGSEVRIKDVATVVDGESDLALKVRYQSEPATLLTVTKKSAVDMIKMRDELEYRLNLFKKSVGNGFSFHVFNDEAVRVYERVSVLKSNAMIGFVLVLIFLLIFLPGRDGLMAALSMPLAMLATAIYMNMSDMTINTMTTIAMIITIGMMVDNSVVIAENFKRLKSMGYKGLDAAIESVQKLWLPITMTGLTTIAAFLPMMMTTGVMGQFVRYIPLVVTAALLISLAEGFFLLPARLVGKDKKVDEVSDGDFFRRWFELPFENVMTFLLRRRWITFLTLSLILLSSFVVMAKFNQFNLFPTTQTQVYIGRLAMESSTDIRLTDVRLGETAGSVLAELGSYAKHIITKAGNDIVNPNDRKGKLGENVGQIVIYVSDEAKILPTDVILERLRRIPAPDGGILQFQAIVNGPPAGEPISAIFRSDDDQQLDSVVHKVLGKLQELKGVFNVQVDDTFGDEEVRFNIDHGTASRLGLNINGIGNTLRTAFSGRIASSVSLNGDDIDLFVRLQDSFRLKLNDVENLRVPTARGDLVPLKIFASAVPSEPATYLKRFDFKRARTVLGDIDERLITVTQANQVVEDTFGSLKSEFPSVSLTYAGAQKETRESIVSLATALGVSLVGIFALLVFLFGSYIKPFIIMSTIPFGLVGFSMAFALQGIPVSFMALIGVIGLGGIVVNSGIVLMSFIEDIRTEGKLSLHEILSKVSSMRLRAVTVTTLTTVSGLMPTAYGIGGADQFISPMAMSMAWGLISGTVLALIWVPCSYAILEDIVTFKANLFRPKRVVEGSGVDWDRTEDRKAG